MMPHEEDVARITAACADVLAAGRSVAMDKRVQPAAAIDH